MSDGVNRGRRVRPLAEWVGRLVREASREFPLVISIVKDTTLREIN